MVSLPSLARRPPLGSQSLTEQLNGVGLGFIQSLGQWRCS